MQPTKAITVVIVALILTGMCGYLLQPTHEESSVTKYDYKGDLTPSVLYEQIDDWVEYNPLTNITGWKQQYGTTIPENVDSRGNSISNPYVLNPAIISYDWDVPVNEVTVDDARVITHWDDISGTYVFYTLSKYLPSVLENYTVAQAVDPSKGIYALYTKISALGSDTPDDDDGYDEDRYVESVSLIGNTIMWDQATQLWYHAEYDSYHKQYVSDGDGYSQYYQEVTDTTTVLGMQLHIYKEERIVLLADLNNPDPPEIKLGVPITTPASYVDPNQFVSVTDDWAIWNNGQVNGSVSVLCSPDTVIKVGNVMITCPTLPYEYLLCTLDFQNQNFYCNGVTGFTNTQSYSVVSYNYPLTISNLVAIKDITSVTELMFGHTTSDKSKMIVRVNSAGTTDSNVRISLNYVFEGLTYAANNIDIPISNGYGYIVYNISDTSDEDDDGTDFVIRVTKITTTISQIPSTDYRFEITEGDSVTPSAGATTYRGSVKVGQIITLNTYDNPMPAKVYVTGTVVAVDPAGILWGNPTMPLKYFFPEQTEYDTRVLFNGFVKYGSDFTVNGKTFEIKDGYINYTYEDEDEPPIYPAIGIKLGERYEGMPYNNIILKFDYQATAYSFTETYSKEITLTGNTVSGSIILPIGEVGFDLTVGNGGFDISAIDISGQQYVGHIGVTQTDSATPMTKVPGTKIITKNLPLKGMAVDFVKSPGSNEYNVKLVFTEAQDFVIDLGELKTTPTLVSYEVSNFNPQTGEVTKEIKTFETELGWVVNASGNWYWQSGIYTISTTTQDNVGLDWTSGTFGLTMTGCCFLMLLFMILGSAAVFRFSEEGFTFMDWVVLGGVSILLLGVAVMG